MVRLLLLDCGILAYARHEGWGYVSGNLYARAAPEKVEITEEYSVTQEISTNPVWEPGPAEGRVEIVVPYDGEKYFTREAADDVKKGIQTRTGEGTAMVGQLLLSDYSKTGELRSVMRLHRNSGVIPIEVPVPDPWPRSRLPVGRPDGLPDQLRLSPGRSRYPSHPTGCRAP